MLNTNNSDWCLKIVLNTFSGRGNEFGEIAGEFTGKTTFEVIALIDR